MGLKSDGGSRPNMWLGSASQGLECRPATKLEFVVRSRSGPAVGPEQLGTAWNANRFCAQRRLASGSATSPPGHIDARMGPGYVPPRWHDAVAVARTYLS